jgi:CRISPR-associated protein Cas1
MLAKGFVGAKIRNQRTLLRRNGRDVSSALATMQDAIKQVNKAPDLDTLRGIEGYAARAYFEKLPSMLDDRVGGAFTFDGRNRRPPRDPVNALLSFAYAMLAREISHAAYGVGLDPYVGFLHTMRPNRPALALDLMEELRPVIGDSVVLNVVNNGVLKLDDFLITPVGCTLRDAGKKRFIQTFERRLDELVTHPRFGTRWSYRRVLEVQARLLGKAILGEIPEYPGFTVR